MRVAFVHDYLKEYGGAERVLEALTEIWPEAPIYTAFYVKNSPAGEAFLGKKIISWWGSKILSFKNLYSPLRFFTPLIWESFDFSEYDLVISSASWYITKSIITKPETLHLCYCHTPPRWLYGYQTAGDWQKILPIKIYGQILAFYLRQYDYLASQRVDYFIANSKETARRIEKFYRRKAEVIYPPVNLKEEETTKIASGDFFQDSYFLVVSRLVSAKNLDLAILACNKLKENLLIVGSGPQENYLKSLAGPTIKFLGQVKDQELAKIYAGAKALLATAPDEDFGITPIEAQSFGTPVIAFRGGGYLESVIEEKTGLFFDKIEVESLIETILDFEKWRRQKLRLKRDCQDWAKNFHKEAFKEKIKKFVEEKFKECQEKKQQS